MARLKEGQPYIELSDGDLNPNSYASTAATDMVEMAVYALDRAGIPLTKAAVRSLAAMYASIVVDVQKPVTGSASMQEGMNSRARLLVKRILRTLPTPVHAATAEEWDTWADAVARRARLMWTVAYGLWSDGADDEPAKLAVDVFTAIGQAKEKLPAAKAALAERAKQQEARQPVGTSGGRASDAASTQGRTHDEPAHDQPAHDEPDGCDDEVGLGDFDV